MILAKKLEFISKMGYSIGVFKIWCFLLSRKTPSPNSAMCHCWLFVREGWRSLLFRSGPNSLRISRNCSRWILAFSWCAGLACGCCLFMKLGLSLDARMRSPALGAVSIVRLVLITFFPFLLSAVAAVFSVPTLFVLICFFKALSFSFASLGVWLLFGSAGWFSRWILLFSDSVGVCILLFFWIRHFPGSRESNVRLWDFLLYFALFFLLCSVDYCMVLPIWADVFWLT